MNNFCDTFVKEKQNKQFTFGKHKKNFPSSISLVAVVQEHDNFITFT